MSFRATTPAKMSLRIRQARRKAELSQQALGELIGVKRSAVSNWESSSTVLPSVQHLAGIAVATDVSFEWLATGRSKMHLGHDPYEGVIAADLDWVESPQERELIEGFRRASQRTQIALLELMDILVPIRKRRSKA